MLKDEVVYVVDRLGAVHLDILVMYLCRLHSWNEQSVRNKLHKVFLTKCVYLTENNYVVRRKDRKVDSSDEQVSRAFCVALEFMDFGETNFMEQRVTVGQNRNAVLMVQLDPDEDEKTENNNALAKLIQISYIPKGNEMAASEALTDMAVPLWMRDYLVRIAIVEPGFRQEYTRKAGYIMFIKFGKDQVKFSQDDVIYTDKEGRWDDVREG